MSGIQYNVLIGREAAGSKHMHQGFLHLECGLWLRCQNLGKERGQEEGTGRGGTWLCLANHITVEGLSVFSLIPSGSSHWVQIDIPLFQTAS